jgi:predicted metal-dependent phosphotriesterase family hydrolase
MPTVETVLGPVAPSQLGHCQAHEHLIVRATPAAEANPALRIDDEEKSRLELNDYRAAGGGAFAHQPEKRRGRRHRHGLPPPHVLPGGRTAVFPGRGRAL